MAIKAPYLLCLALCPITFTSCFDKVVEKNKTIEVNGMKITISVASVKDVEAGVAGAPHAPIIIPYVTTTKTMAITLQVKDGPLLIAESQTTDKLLSKKEVEGLLEDVQVWVSPDKKHIAYFREQGRLFHFFDEKSFFSMEADDMKEGKEPDWKSMEDPQKLAYKLMGDTANTGINQWELWNAISGMPDDHELSIHATELWHTTGHAHYFVENRSWGWKKSSDKWKAAINKLFDKCDQLYTLNYMKEHDITNDIRDLGEICHYSGDEGLLKKFHKLLARGLGGEAPLHDEFRAEYTKCQSDTNFPKACDQMKQTAMNAKNAAFSRDPSTRTIINFMSISYTLEDAALEDQCFRMICRRWPGDSLTFPTVYSVGTYTPIPTEERPGMIKRAETILDTKDSSQAIRLLEKIASCEQINLYRKKYGRKFYRNDCPEEKP